MWGCRKGINYEVRARPEELPLGKRESRVLEESSLGDTKCGRGWRSSPKSALKVQPSFSHWPGRGPSTNTTFSAVCPSLDTTPARCFNRTISSLLPDSSTWQPIQEEEQVKTVLSQAGGHFPKERGHSEITVPPPLLGISTRCNQGSLESLPPFPVLVEGWR